MDQTTDPLDEEDDSISLPNLGSISPDVLSRYLHKLFRLGDKDGNGKLDQNEVANLLSRSGLAFPPEVVKHVMVEADIDEEGFIQYRSHLNPNPDPIPSRRQLTLIKCIPRSS